MQPEPMQTIRYGTTQIAYDVVFSRRTTLAIQVYPDGRVSVRAPQGCAAETIAGIVRKRAGWIVKQQHRFRSYAPPVVVPRDYVSGESYRYLGRQYRLKVLTGLPEQVVLGWTEMYVTVRQKEPRQVQRVLERWYRAEAQRIFAERLAACWPQIAHLDVPFPTLSIRRMTTRWGAVAAVGGFCSTCV
jgi:hypothetical protein